MPKLINRKHLTYRSMDSIKRWASHCKSDDKYVWTGWDEKLLERLDLEIKETLSQKYKKRKEKQ